MDAKMTLRDLYLLADTTFDLEAALAAVDRLCRRANPADLHLLIIEGWLGDDDVPSPISGTALGSHRDNGLRRDLGRAIGESVTRFAASLRGRDVSRFRFDDGGPPGVDAYITGGVTPGDGPTDAYDAWDLWYETDRMPPEWADLIGAAGGLLHPFGGGPAVVTVTFRAWSRVS